MIRTILAAATVLLGATTTFAAGPAPMRSPHTVDMGFFDIHVCNWTDRPLFFMALFSTTRFDEITRIEILDIEGRSLGDLDLTKFRLTVTPGKPEKRVFIRQVAIPEGARDGWYSARVTTRSGAQSVARDFVVITRLPIAAGAVPKPESDDIPMPRELRWDPVPGAKHYQIFITDLWDGEKLIYTSPFLDEPRAPLPAGLLKPGGLYSWRVHARDVNEHELLGDFNHGSLGAPMRFSVAP